MQTQKTLNTGGEKRREEVMIISSRPMIHMRGAVPSGDFLLLFRLSIRK